MTPDRHLPWVQVHEFVEAPDPSAHPIAGEPKLEIVVGGGGDHLGLRLPPGNEPSNPIPISPLAEIEYRVITVEGRPVHEVRTGNRDLFPYFYDFICSIADKVQLDRQSPTHAFNTAIRDWKSLLRNASGLTEEQQTGLLGELWFLHELAQRIQARALPSWVGPQGEAHDFRVGVAEIEVKAARTERRIHTISSLQQLASSPGAILYLVSVQLARAGTGTGFSLASLLDSVENTLRAHHQDGEFREVMARAFNLSWEDRTRYDTRMKLRTTPIVCEVDQSFPRLTRQDIDELDRRDAHRILDATYRLDLDGLGTDATQFISRIAGIA